METDILEQLYRRYGRAAYLYCLSLCGDGHTAQDLVSEAFVKAYLSLPEEVPSFRYWLFRVCRNLWIDHCRKAQHTTGPEVLEFIPAPNTPETIYLQNERKKALWAALNILSPKERELITLHYFSGLPLKEIAPLMGKSHEAVRQRMVRLRNKLRQEMEAQGYKNNDIFDHEWEQNTAPENEMKQIQKSIRRRNWKIIAVSVSAALVLLGILTHGVIPLAERFFWDPTKTTYGSHTDLETMLHVYTDLFTPGYNTFHVNYQRSGFASYDLEVPVFFTAQDNIVTATGALKKNILSLDQNFFNPMRKNYPFPRRSTPDYSPIGLDIDILRQRLSQLPEYIRLEATICFPEDLSMEELMEFRSTYSDLLITWVAVRSAEPSDSMPPLLGMDTFTGGTVFDGFLKEYRYFDAKQITEATHLEKHFKTRLQFYIDQLAKGQAFYRYDEETLNRALTYVEENGVYTYGCVVTASPQVLLNLLDSGIVCTIDLVDCWIDISTK